MKNIIIILIILIVLMLTMSWFLNRGNIYADALFTIISPQEREFPVTEFPSSALQSVTIAAGDTLSAIPLKYFLQPFLKNTDWHQLIFQSRDSGQLTIDRQELDKLFLTLNNKDDETWLRLVIPSDDFHQRWLKYIVRIQLK